MTNIVLLSLTLVTNQQQAIVGQSGGKALLASQETVAQQIELGYLKRDSKPVSIGTFSKVISTRLVTNAVPIAMPAPPTSIPVPPVAPSPMPPAIPSRTDAPRVSSAVNTNAPGYKRRLEREARMRGTNTPTAKP
jgi:hypothetical protein